MTAPSGKQILAWKLEEIITRRVFEKRVEGYTLETSLELAECALRLAATPSARDVREALEQCRNYIASPLRMSSDDDEKKRRDGIVAKAEAALSNLDAAAPAAGGDAARDALAKINDIRNSIIGTHSLNWSEHVYPLVAALEAAGFEGMEYPAAREYYGTLVERAVKAEDALAALQAPAHSDAVRPSPMPPTSDRSWLDEKKDYLESDQDWARDNDEAIGWLADNHAAIRAALTAPAAKAPAVSEADVGRLVKACRNILPYLRWTIGPESPGHHPTMPSAVGAFEHAVNEAALIQSAAQGGGNDNDEMETCIACAVPFVDGDMVYWDVGGGHLHEACCGPERECYVNADGNPLKDGAPIPRPHAWRSDPPSQEASAPKGGVS